MNQTSGAALNFDDNSREQEAAYQPQPDMLVSFHDGLTLVCELDNIVLDME